MNRRQLIQSILGISALPALAFSAEGYAASSSRGIVGQQAPELDVDFWIDAEGNPTDFKLAQHDGKWVVLKCFQSWCPGCHKHGFPSVKKMSDALASNQNVVFAGIQTVFEGYSINTKDKVREIQLQYDLRMPMGHDPGSSAGQPLTMKNYRTGGTPWIIVIDPQRNVVFNGFSIDTDKAIDYLSSPQAAVNKS